MKSKYIFSAICAWVCMAGMAEQASAQAGGAGGQDSTKRFFNAMDYRLQKRYVPAGKVVKKEDKGKNMTLSVQAGGLKVRGGMPFLYSGGLSVGKEVSAFNTYRMTLTGGMAQGVKMGGLEVDHLFNISDYLNGYRKEGRVNLYTVWGLGAYATKPDDRKTEWAGGLHAGLQLQYHLGGHWEWYVEPKVYLFTDGIDGVTSPKRYDLGYGVNTGLTYRFTGLPLMAKSEDAGDNLFIEAAVGVQGDYASSVKDALGRVKPLGPAMSLSVGKWFMPIGFRATGFGGMHYTPTTGGLKSKEVYVGGRFEGMLNLNTIFKPSVDDPRWEVNVAAGYELGVLAHRDPEYASSGRIFHGPTGAMQLLYFVTEQVGIFGEGRYSKSNYDQPYLNGRVDDRSMQNLSVMFGVQYRRRKEVFDRRKGFFKPYNFVQASLGGNFPFRTWGIGLSNLQDWMGQQLSVGVGRQYTPVSALRAQIEVARWADPKSIPYPFSISADYLLNITNVLDNYNENRIFDLNAFAGVVYTHHNLLDKNYFGIQAGLQQEFKVDDRWSIYLEEFARLYKGRITPSARAFTTHSASVLLGGNLGVKYRF